ncbi:cell wall-active antibiotics response protein LiaF [Paenibacillus caui]|uniref:cell wall-active antibiotics response protein LiaF n=1 Tax=Paenibacillus caui TaxID=2873927 RepID=UPI001CA9DF21|nr:cell wall-active antibiotics response protein LiaF [Paenibacillus caui]
MFNGWSGRAFGGLILLGLGVLLLLNMLGIVDVSIGYLFATYWPVFVILAGLSQLSHGFRHGGAALGGMIVTAVGAFFLARNLDLIDLSAGDFFKFAVPVVLIVAGLSVLFKPSRRNRSGDSGYERPVPPAAPIDSSLHPDFGSTVDEAFEQAFPEEKKRNDEEEKKHKAGDEKRRHHSYSGYDHGHAHKFNRSGFIGDVRLGDDYFELKPTNISHFIGDTIIDLTKAQIPYGETKINVSAFIGDVKVFIPADADLGISVSSSSFIGDMKVLKEKQGGFLSSVSSHTPNYNETNKRVKLSVSVFVGDIRVNTVG